MQNSDCKKTLLSILLLVLVILLVSSSVATAATVTVDCSSTKAKIKTITAGLALLPLSGPSTLLVSGTCNENVTIDSYQNLIVKGNPTATIYGGTDINYDTVTITSSRDVRIESLTVTGGGSGIVCGFDSICRVTNVVVHDELSTGVYCGIFSSLRLTSVTMENNGDYGMQIRQSGSVVMGTSTIRGNGVATEGAGILMDPGSSLYEVSSFIQNNGVSGGIQAMANATLVLQDTTVTGNSGDGVSVSGGSTARILRATITGNLGSGVSIGDLSFAEFRWAGLNVSGNSGPYDVTCNPVSPATRGIQRVISSGGTTNCTVPEP